MVDFKRDGALSNFTLGNYQLNGDLGDGAIGNTTGLTPTGEAKELDFSLSSRLDSFEVGTTTGNTDIRFTKALDSFNDRMDTILGHDAMALANGVTPWSSGDALTDDQQNKMKGAAKDLLMEVPLDQLAPGLLAGLTGALGADNGSLKALGEAGGDAAKNMLENMRDKSPAAFYGLAGTAAVALGVHGYENGSQALRKLGIKPEFKTGLFNDRLEARASADWGPKFADPSLELDMSTNILLGRSGRVRAGISANTNGEGAFHVDGNYRRGDWSVGGEARFETDGDYRAGVRARWEPNDRTEFAVSGSVDNRGESRVGVGFKLKF